VFTRRPLANIEEMKETKADPNSAYRPMTRPKFGSGKYWDKYGKAKDDFPYTMHQVDVPVREDEDESHFDSLIEGTLVEGNYAASLQKHGVDPKVAKVFGTAVGDIERLVKSMVASIRGGDVAMAGSALAGIQRMAGEALDELNRM
jgi:hypothetical protein